MRSTSSTDPKRQLTPREVEVLQSIADGDQYKHIADRLGIAIQTVKAHVHSIHLKLGSKTPAHAVRFYMERSKKNGKQRANIG